MSDTPPAISSLESIESAAKSAKDLESAIKGLSGSLTEWVQKLTTSENKVTTFKDSIDAARKNLTMAGSSAGNFGSDISKMATSAVGGLSQIAALSDGLHDAAGSFSTFGQAGVQAGSDIENAGKAVLGAVNMFSSLSGLGAVLPPGLDKAIGQLSGVLKKYGERALEATSFTDKLEQGFVQMLATSGNLGDVLTSESNRLGDIEKPLNAFIDQTYEISRATGQGVEKVQSFMAAMNNLRGQGGPSFNESTVSAGESAISSIEAATKVAMVTSGGLATVQKELERAYDNFNQSGTNAKETLNYISNLTEVSSGLGINFTVVETTVAKMADQFEHLGNNSTSALKILNDFVPAFRNAGASAKQASDMVAGMTDGIHNMDRASKAFLSGRSGGPGGLQGSFRIDSLIAQGKLDEVAKMAEQNLRKQFGGKIVTLDKAAESQTAAAQYQRQLSFIKNSGFGSMIKDDDQAARFFKAMQSGPISGNALKNNVLSGDAALQQKINQGDSIQQRQMTSIQQDAVDLQKFSTVGKMKVANTVRTNLGTLGKDEKGNPSAMADYVTRNSVMGSVAARTGSTHDVAPENQAAAYGLDAMSHLTSFIEAMTGPQDKGRPQAAQKAPVVASRVTGALNTKNAMAPSVMPQTGVLTHPAANMNQGSAAMTVTTAVPVHTFHRPTEKPLSAAPRQDSNELTISGELTTKCPDCGTKGDARILGVAQNLLTKSSGPGR